MSVGPAGLEAAHPLGKLGPTQIGVFYTSDTGGSVWAGAEVDDAVSTASAVLRDSVFVLAGQ